MLPVSKPQAQSNHASRITCPDASFRPCSAVVAAAVASQPAVLPSWNAVAVVVASPAVVYSASAARRLASPL